ncbi:WD repeat-containing protein 47, partial [Pseudolycoriella hygida]
MSVPVMLSARLALREEDVVRLSLEFLHNRELHISQLSIERETGVINGQYSDDILFLRQLILDGQWDDVIEFIQPLEALQAFDMKRFRFSILKHKFIELLCIKSEAGGALIAAGQGMNSVDGAVEEVVQVLEDLEKLAPSKEEYSGLCLLLTLPRLADHLQYRNWNPSFSRVQCFQDVFPLVEKFLPGEKKPTAVSASKNDRLIQLVIKGVLYESCVTYCQAKATGTAEGSAQEMTFSKLLDGSVGFSDSDLSLLSWLQSIPAETFSVPFEQKTLNVDVERLERPSLETSWTEHMLITPIKPKTFPHSVMPFTRPRSAADIMTRSLLPTLDGLPSGKLMTSSVDRLFENDGEPFVSGKFSEFNQGLSSIQEIASVQSKSPEPNFQNLYPKPLSLAEQTGRESPSTTPSTAKSSRRDSLSERVIVPSQIQQMIHPPHPPITNLPVKSSAAVVNEPDVSLIARNSPALPNNMANTNGGELFEKFQRQKLNRENGNVNGSKTHQSNDNVQTANNKSNCDIEPSILKTESSVNNS